ncbi:MAG: hypothetical protein ABJP45_18560 [Cyclobacteriaceae bacterium]
MSKKIKERTKQLATKEVALKKKLMGTSGGIKSKANKVGKTALIGGLITLLIYGLYKAFVQGETKSKKSKVQGQTSSGIITEKLTTFLLPYLGKVLDGFLDKKASKPSVVSAEAKEETPSED